MAAGSFLLPLLVCKGQRRGARAPLREKNPLRFFTHAGKRGEGECMAPVQVAILTEEHFRQPCWLAPAHKQEWVPVCAIVSKKRPSAYSSCSAE